MGLGVSEANLNLWKLNYEYGELNANGTVDAQENTGNLAKQTISFDGASQPFVQEYKYDALYRLTEAKETEGSSQNWKQEFGYDRYGNRTSYNKFLGTVVQTLTAKDKPTIDANNNRFDLGQGYNYDSIGNLITDADGRSVTFNGDNKQTEVKDSSNNVVGTYFYDGDGARIKKVTNTETVVYVYSGGKKVVEYSTDPATTASSKYLTGDHLGSPRVISDQSGAVLSRRDFMPFGEDLKDGVGARSNSNKYGIDDKVREGFTGYEKDKETGLDFAEARMYESRHARFTAVDPLMASGKSANPQSFNRYVYVRNNPLSLVDPSGLCPDCDDETEIIATIHTAIDSFGKWLTEIADGWTSRGNPRSSRKYDISTRFERAIVEAQNRQYGFDEAREGQRYAFGGGRGPNVDKWLLKTNEAANFAKNTSPVGAVDNFYRAASKYDKGKIGTGGLIVAGGAVFLEFSGNGASSGAKKSVKMLTTSSKYVPNAGGVIRSFVTSQDRIFFRVSSASQGEMGSFLTAVRPKSRNFAREALALPQENDASLIQKVFVPAGTRIQRSRALPQPKWHRFRGGGEQFELLEYLPKNSFGTREFFK